MATIGSSSSSHQPMAQQRFPQNPEITRLKEVIQALESKQDKTVEVTSKQIHETIPLFKFV